MCYKLEKPVSEQGLYNFVVEYNHNKGLHIEETDVAIYALEPWEILVEGEVTDNTEAYEKEQEEKERIRIANLRLTKREVFLAIYKNLKITPEEIKKMITDNEALIEFEYANEYYRGNPLVNKLGLALGYTEKDLDYLFEHKSFPNLEKGVTLND